MSLFDNPRVRTLQTRLVAVQAELREALADVTAGEVADYLFDTPDGPMRLSDLFSGHRHLIVMHSMGIGCANCAMVADGFNGLYPHLAERAAFALAGPDAPQVQAAFAAARGWRFPVICDARNGFAGDMGFLGPHGERRPGVSAFRREADGLHRVSASDFHAETDFCAIWRLLDLLPDGRAGWRPQLSPQDDAR